MRFSVCTRVPVRHVLVYCVALVFAYAVLLPCVDIEHYSPKSKAVLNSSANFWPFQVYIAIGVTIEEKLLH